ncbi:hypothetical protein JZ751_015737 [Albula glossodonta]|uniref:Uncharacterized protein n=1 Tax=Albula glossodonta TaxID=121402 RepID=A0A8T2N1A5_9TELE|nr:hypothetical protein JZ751_015737 [Albula glossodonta]
MGSLIEGAGEGVEQQSETLTLVLLQLTYFSTPLPQPQEQGQTNGAPEHSMNGTAEGEGEGDPNSTNQPQIQQDEEQAEDPEVPGEEALGPDDVVCDSCMESRRRALKSCLTCLVSYCDTHLRPHLENPKFQSHRLVEPLRDIERRTCEAHRKPLELYCSLSCLRSLFFSAQLILHCAALSSLRSSFSSGQLILHCLHLCSECGDLTEAADWRNRLRGRPGLEKELSDRQQEILKTVTAAENAINKLQTNTVSIEVKLALTNANAADCLDRLPAS